MLLDQKVLITWVSGSIYCMCMITQLRGQVCDGTRFDTAGSSPVQKHNILCRWKLTAVILSLHTFTVLHSECICLKFYTPSWA